MNGHCDCCRETAYCARCENQFEKSYLIYTEDDEYICKNNCLGDTKMNKEKAVPVPQLTFADQINKMIDDKLEVHNKFLINLINEGDQLLHKRLASLENDRSKQLEINESLSIRLHGINEDYSSFKLAANSWYERVMIRIAQLEENLKPDFYDIPDDVKAAIQSDHIKDLNEKVNVLREDILSFKPSMSMCFTAHSNRISKLEEWTEGESTESLRERIAWIENNIENDNTINNRVSKLAEYIKSLHERISLIEADIDIDDETTIDARVCDLALSLDEAIKENSRMHADASRVMTKLLRDQMTLASKIDEILPKIDQESTTSESEIKLSTTEGYIDVLNIMHKFTNSELSTLCGHAYNISTTRTTVKT